MSSCTPALLLAVTAALAAAPPLAAQQTLAELEARFAAERDRLYGGDRPPSAEQQDELMARHKQQLEEFLAERAAGADRWYGRMMLADLCLMQRDRDGAVQAVRAIDPDAAPPVLLLLAADLATELELTDLRRALIDKALARPAPFAERMEMGSILMTLLVEVERGEQVFADAFAAAEDDEQRARVRWHRCEAIREREDLPENSYYAALDQLAEQFPDTYYGGVARDRAKASQFQLGAPAIPFTATTVAGQQVVLQELRGEPVLLVFWTATDPRAEQLLSSLEALRQDPGPVLLGISMDADREEFQRRIAALEVAWPQICDGRGFDADLALRYHVETAPTIIVLDRQGRIAGLNLHTDTEDARRALAEAVARASRRDG